jgi:hypothetical protein
MTRRWPCILIVCCLLAVAAREAAATKRNDSGIEPQARDS